MCIRAASGHANHELNQHRTLRSLTPEWVLDSIKAKRDLPHFKKWRPSSRRL